eukprot:2776352-Prymnesium_polylepis.1
MTRMDTFCSREKRPRANPPRRTITRHVAVGWPAVSLLSHAWGRHRVTCDMLLSCRLMRVLCCYAA